MNICKWNSAGKKMFASGRSWTSAVCCLCCFIKLMKNLIVTGQPFSKQFTFFFFFYLFTKYSGIHSYFSQLPPNVQAEGSERPALGLITLHVWLPNRCTHQLLAPNLVWSSLLWRSHQPCAHHRITPVMIFSGRALPLMWCTLFSRFNCCTWRLSQGNWTDFWYLEAILLLISKASWEKWLESPTYWTTKVEGG